MKKIRKNVFETNSSSAHTISICNKEPYMNWELESYKGKTLVYKKDDMFDSEKFYNTKCTSTGTKFSMMISLLNDFVDDYDVKELLGFDKYESVFNLPLYSWISEFLKENFEIEFIWNNWEENIEVNGVWLDESHGETLYNIYKHVYSINDSNDKTQPWNYKMLKIVEILKDKNLFLEFFNKFVLDENVILISEYEEW